ncbi:TPA: hypothetical protein QEM85_005127 [Pseudomonas putida]|uniref:hypothetical protein n=1 Tax=Pseudomonas putida TaxID=303 RepID=UPI00110C9CF5|nr:hypothetical protein [Pseudomonas putida]MDD1996258.1 hypothetical protein [Pseudomonas putida]HDS0921138.1 hypothetical protein [Pseudomonas putida]HDS0936422.1 hypothetical protein [Pseudomonas putida]HDS1786216.1 hypothetical protein [Pseudomonas putida]HDS3801688.1 hypothetical protein [Pseudomonas putida]
MLWEHYVFREGSKVDELWDNLYTETKTSVVYLTAKGFDTRARVVMDRFVSGVVSAKASIESSKLILVGLADYELDTEIASLTTENIETLKTSFFDNATIEEISIGASGDEDMSSSNALSLGIKKILGAINGYSDIILDVSAMPRVVYLSILTNILNKLIPNKNNSDNCNPLASNKINFQVLVAEDARLDGLIRAEDPSNDLIYVPGFAGAMHVESARDWPIVWFPVLGENRSQQMQKLIELAEIPDSAEICPILPHPSKDPRRADNLLVEYSEVLFDSRSTPTTNIFYVHESNPFEAYRQLLTAMKRYRDSMRILGGCKLVVSPLGSKLMTIGAGLACFEMKPTDLNSRYGVAIPHSEPKRYFASLEDLKSSNPTIYSLLLTGESYINE